MAEYLDMTGLTYYTGKVQTYAQNTTKASNKVTAMTGYTKGSSFSAITTSDTLNQAIGKLEYSLDYINTVLEDVL